MLPEIFPNILGVIYLPLFLLLLYSSPQSKPPSPFPPFPPSYHMYPFSKVPPTMVFFGSLGSCGWSAMIWGIVIHTKYKAKYEVMAQLVECLLTVNVLWVWFPVQHEQGVVTDTYDGNTQRLRLEDQKCKVILNYRESLKWKWATWDLPKRFLCVYIYVCVHAHIYTYICGIYVGEINITDIRDIYFMDYIDDW